MGYAAMPSMHQLLHFSNSVVSCRIATILSSVLRFNHVQSRISGLLSPGYRPAICLL